MINRYFEDGMIVQNREGVCGRIRRIPDTVPHRWQVQDIHLSVQQLPSGADYTELMSPEEVVAAGWRPYNPKREAAFKNAFEQLLRCGSGVAQAEEGSQAGIGRNRVQ